MDFRSLRGTKTLTTKVTKVHGGRAQSAGPFLGSGVHSFVRTSKRVGLSFLPVWSLPVKRLSHLFPVVIATVFLQIFPGSTFTDAQSSGQQGIKPLTIEQIYSPGGITGRGPETMEWSPDGSRLSYVQRDDKGELGELWYVDAATGEKKVLVTAAKLAALAPDRDKVKNEREKERLTRYHVAAYIWARDSKHLIFDSQGQLWLYDLGSSTAVQFTSQAQPVCAADQRKERETAD